MFFHAYEPILASSVPWLVALQGFTGLPLLPYSVSSATLS